MVKTTQRPNYSRSAILNMHQRLLIKRWLDKRLNAMQSQWLNEKVVAISKSNSDRDLHIALGMAPRKLGKSDLRLDESELSDAREACEGWCPSDWSTDAAARIYILLTVAEKNEANFGTLISSLYSTADAYEAITYLRGLPLYPESAELTEMIGAGLRTNMGAVFEAIAHNNPYPAVHFDEHRWNHMILKALFIGSKLHLIIGLDHRANPELSEMLRDYAHERWAAKRAVSPELWRCVGPFANKSMVDDLLKVCKSENPMEHSAGALALSQCPLPEAAMLLEGYPVTATAIATGELTWKTLSQKLES